MAREIYESEPRFRDEVRRCCNLLPPELNLLALLAGSTKEAEIREKDPDSDSFLRTGIAQPALFVVEYALAQWGRSSVRKYLAYIPTTP